MSGWRWGGCFNTRWFLLAPGRAKAEEPSRWTTSYYYTITFHQLKTLPPAVHLPKTRLWYLDGISGFSSHVVLGKNGPSNTPSWAHHLRSRGLVCGASNASKPEAFQPSSTSNTQGGLSCWWFKVSIPKVVERDQSALRDGSFKIKNTPLKCPIRDQSDISWIWMEK